MQDHDRNIALDHAVNERTDLFVSDVTSRSNTKGMMLKLLENCKNSTPLSSSPKKLIDYRKQPAPVTPIDQFEYLLTPNRHNSASLRSFDETELPSLALSLEDSLGSYSLTDTHSCLHESVSSSYCNDKVEFYLKVPKREPSCQRRASLQSLMSQMQISSNTKSDRYHLSLEAKASSPRKSRAAPRLSRRLSVDDCFRQQAATCFSDHATARHEPSLQGSSGEDNHFDSVEERQERLKRLSGFCSIRNLNKLVDKSPSKKSESESNSSEHVKIIDGKQENESSKRTAQLQKISGLVSMRHLKEDKTCCTESREGSWPWKSRDSYPFEIVVPYPDLSRSQSFGDQERTTKRKKKTSRRSFTLSTGPTSRLRRSVSTGEAMDVQRSSSCSSDSLRRIRRWSSSWDGKHEQPNSTFNTVSYMQTGKLI